MSDVCLTEVKIAFWIRGGVGAGSNVLDMKSLEFVVGLGKHLILNDYLLDIFLVDCSTSHF
jgi:hypothetical protein